MPAAAACPCPLVIDTNWALDFLLFADPAAQPVHAALQSGRAQWLATAAMRDELARVLAYPALQKQMALRQRSAQQALQGFDQLARLHPAAARAPVVCKDPDDQPFIDLALAHRATLLSKDRYVLATRKRLARLGVCVSAACPAALLPSSPLKSPF
ncbi:MAG: PIN domain-containing protein [Ottowia sp.]